MILNGICMFSGWWEAVQACACGGLALLCISGILLALYIFIENPCRSGKVTAIVVLCLGGNMYTSTNIGVNY